MRGAAQTPRHQLEWAKEPTAGIGAAVIGAVFMEAACAGRLLEEQAGAWADFSCRGARSPPLLD